MLFLANYTTVIADHLVVILPLAAAYMTIFLGFLTIVGAVWLITTPQPQPVWYGRKQQGADGRPGE